MPPPLPPTQAQADEPSYDLANQAIREIAADNIRLDHPLVFDDELPPDENNSSTSTTAHGPSSKTSGGVTHNDPHDSQSSPVLTAAVPASTSISSNTSNTAKTSDNTEIGRPLLAQRMLNNVDITSRKKSRAKAAKQKSTPRGAAIRKGKRVKVQRRALKYVIPVEAPAYALLDHHSRNGYNFYGTVLGPKQKSGKYCVRFDELPSQDNEYLLVRSSLAVLETGEGEPAYDHASEHAAEIAESCGGQEKAPKIKPSQDAIDAFLALSPEEQKSAKYFVYPYGPDANESISRKILEYVQQFPFHLMRTITTHISSHYSFHNAKGCQGDCHGHHGGG